MTSETFMARFRTFFGLRPEPPRNDFRNPIWGSNDDDDDGDELYTRQQNIEVYGEVDIHREITKQMQDMFKTFGSMFGDMKSFFHDEDLNPFAAITQASPDADSFDGSNIRDYYLKPGYHSHQTEEHKDIDLDGKISSEDMSGLLKKNDGHGTVTPFNGNLVPGRSFCQTVITSSVRKPETIETRRIVKNGNEVIEETTTSAGPDSQNPRASGSNIISHNDFFLPDLTSLFKTFY